MQLDYDPPTGDVIPDERIERTAYRHLVDVHGWEEDRAADVAAKTVKEALR